MADLGCIQVVNMNIRVIYFGDEHPNVYSNGIYKRLDRITNILSLGRIVRINNLYRIGIYLTNYLQHMPHKSLTLCN